MTNGLPRWFRILFVVVMLALCGVMVTQIIHHQSLTAQITTLQGKVDSAEKRLAKQEKELTEYSAELPQVLAELETAEPAAQAAVQQVADLKAERKLLREENAAQAEKIAGLEAQLATLPSPEESAGKIDDARTTLTEAQTQLSD